jgi:hypothetical protein
VIDGTSFSAPLTVRYISFEFSQTMAPKDIVKQLKSRLDPKGFIPPSKHYAYAAFEAQQGDLNLAEGFDPTIRDNVVLIPSLAYPLMIRP